MAFIYIELHRGDKEVWEGHIFQIFPDDETPPIPDDERLARIEITDLKGADLRNMLAEGLGKIVMDDSAHSRLKETRDFSADSATLRSALEPDVDLKDFPERKFKLSEDLPSKPAGSVFAFDPNDPVPRYRCITDPLHWFDASVVEAAGAPVPFPIAAGQGLSFEEIP